MTKRNENKASRAFSGRSEHEAACYRRWAGESGGFLLSHGNDHDSLYAIELLEKVDLAGSDILADWAYGAEKDSGIHNGAMYIVPLKSNISNS